MPMLNQRSDQQIWRPELSRQRGPRGCTIAGALIVHIFAAGGLFFILKGHEDAFLHQVALSEENAAAIARNRDLRLPLDDTAALRAELLTSAGPDPRAELMPELGADTDAEASDREAEPAQPTALPSSFESPHEAALAEEPKRRTAVVRRSPPRRPNPTVGFAAPPPVALPKPMQNSPRYQSELLPPVEPPPAPLPGEPWQFVH
jgi:hypothetical protein